MLQHTYNLRLWLIVSDVVPTDLRIIFIESIDCDISFNKEVNDVRGERVAMVQVEQKTWKNQNNGN